MVARKPHKIAALGRQRDALERALAALPTGPEHAALVESCRGLADELDMVPTDWLWREYRLALKVLMDRVTGGGDNDGFDEEYERMRAEMGNASDSGQT